MHPKFILLFRLRSFIQPQLFTNLFLGKLTTGPLLFFFPQLGSSTFICVDSGDGCNFFFFLPFLGPLPRHMEVPGLGVESEL